MYRVFILIAAMAPLASGQLYLVTGASTLQGWPTPAVLFQVGDNGSVTETETLVNAPRWEDDPRGKDHPRGVCPAWSGWVSPTNGASKVPAELLKGLTSSDIMVTSEIRVNDSHVLLLGLRFKRGPDRDLIFRKSDRTWHMLPSDAYHPRYTSGFGRYVASPQFAPGKLHIYDTDTGRVFTIGTDQQGSEVLLIEGGIVYWRSGRKLYSARLTDSGVGKPRLLAADDALLNTTYAFFKH